MNEYLPQYHPYTTMQYQALQWEGILGGLMGVLMLVALAAWAFSLVKKAFKGEEVKFPL